MIQKDCFTSAWIDTVSKQLKYNDKNLIEKGVNTIEKYHSPQNVANLQIADTLTNKLNKARVVVMMYLRAIRNFTIRLRTRTEAILFRIFYWMYYTRISTTIRQRRWLFGRRSSS